MDSFSQKIQLSIMYIMKPQYILRISRIFTGEIKELKRSKNETFGFI